MGYFIAWLFIEFLAVAALGWPCVVAQLLTVAAVLLSEGCKKKNK